MSVVTLKPSSTKMMSHDNVQVFFSDMLVIRSGYSSFLDILRTRKKLA